MRDLVAGGELGGVHDASDGLGVTLAEMAVRSGVGFQVSVLAADHAWLFAESASRVVACVAEGREDVVEAPREASDVAGGEASASA